MCSGFLCKVKWKVLCMFFFIVIVFFVCWLLYYVVFIGFVFGYWILLDLFFMSGLIFVGLINLILNFIIYGVF